MLPYREILGLTPIASYKALIANMHVLRQHQYKIRTIVHPSIYNIPVDIPIPQFHSHFRLLKIHGC
jgi:hypothetical protein